MITVIVISVDRLVPSRLVWVSSDTLWELAAAEVHSRESGGAEERDGGEAVNERTVLLMGSKAGVCVSLISHGSACILLLYCVNSHPFIF